PAGWPPYWPRRPNPRRRVSWRRGAPSRGFNRRATRRRAARRFRSQVPLEPADDPAQALQAVEGLAAARELVALVREADELHLAAQVFQRREELLALLDRATQVALRVDDEERRGDLGDVRERRAVEVELR